MKLEECIWKYVSENQRKKEWAKGVDGKGTKLYKAMGCYTCNGNNEACEVYKPNQRYYKIDKVDFEARLLKLCEEEKDYTLLEEYFEKMDLVSEVGLGVDYYFDIQKKDSFYVTRKKQVGYIWEEKSIK